MITRIVCATATAARFLPRFAAIRRNYRDRCVPLARYAAQAACTIADFNQRLPRRCPTALSLAGAEVIPAGQACPGRQVTGGGKPRHVPADFRQDDLRDPESNPRNRQQPADLIPEKAQGLVDPLVITVDQPLQVRQVVHQRSEQEAVVFRHRTPHNSV